MRDLNKKQKNAENLTTVVRTPKKSAGDAASKQLRGASSKLGNAAVEDKLLKKPEQAAAKSPEAQPKAAEKAAEQAVATPVSAEKKAESPAKDQQQAALLAAVAPKANPEQRALLDHICGRVKAMYEVQLVEKAQMTNQRAWFRDVARGGPGQHLPDPTRFHEATKLYQKAADALCAGNVSQGAKLMEKAMAAEREALENLPQMVEEKLSSVERSPGTPPDAMSTAMGQSAPAERLAMPKEMDFARKILAVGDQMEKTPPLERAKKHSWFSELEEDEDEAAKGKKGEAKRA
ncbi:MAG: hypothetical protein RL071_543 [Pseudomonadota bacterium]|jgi:hypothetical protein